MKLEIINDLLNGRFDSIPEFSKTVVRIFISSTFTGFFFFNNLFD